MTTISVIVGSTRQGRFSEKPAQWIFQHLKKRKDVEARLLDLRDFPMPFFDQPVPPAMPGRAPYESEVVKKWTAEIARSDGFIFVTPEYNFGTSAVLKNALDWVYPEWNRKAVAFVSTAVPQVRAASSSCAKRRLSFSWRRFARPSTFPSRLSGRTSRVVMSRRDLRSLRHPQRR
jgi:NAD(P)H-dependent FMN reductase